MMMGAPGDYLGVHENPDRRRRTHGNPADYRGIEVNDDMEVRGYAKLDKGFTYYGLQCEVGGEYEYEDNDNYKFFFYKNPLNVLKKYSSVDDRYAVVIGSGLMPTSNKNTKVIAQRIRIEKEISLLELIEAGVKYAVDAAHEYIDTRTLALALSSGCGLIAANYRDWSLAFNVNDWSIAVNEGRHSMAANNGDWSVAVNRGDFSAAITEGHCSVAVCTSDNSAAIVEGKGGIAIAFGYKAKAKARTGSWLVLTDWQEREDGLHIRDVKSFYVDGVIVKADTFYQCEDGQLVEAK